MIKTQACLSILLVSRLRREREREHVLNFQQFIFRWWRTFGGFTAGDIGRQPGCEMTLSRTWSPYDPLMEMEHGGPVNALWNYLSRWRGITYSDIRFIRRFHMISLVLYWFFLFFLSNHSWFASKMASPWGVLVVSRWRWKWPRLRRLWPSGGPHALPQVGPCGIHPNLTHRGCIKKTPI